MLTVRVQLYLQLKGYTAWRDGPGACLFVVSKMQQEAGKVR